MGQLVGFNYRPKATIGDTIGLEVDLRSSDRKERTLFWFVNGIQQKYYFYNVPETIKFALAFEGTDNRVEFVSFEELPQPTYGSKEDSLSCLFEGVAL